MEWSEYGFPFGASFEIPAMLIDDADWSGRCFLSNDTGLHCERQKLLAKGHFTLFP
jgi:hypothetical protein